MKKFFDIVYKISPLEGNVADIYNYCNDMAKKDKCGPECDFWIEHKGCFFREGRTPREWENC